jgi:hypothetical protein
MSFKYEYNATREAFSLTLELKFAIQAAGFLSPKAHFVFLTNAFIPKN